MSEHSKSKPQSSGVPSQHLRRLQLFGPRHFSMFHRPLGSGDKTSIHRCTLHDVYKKFCFLVDQKGASRNQCATSCPGQSTATDHHSSVPDVHANGRGPRTISVGRFRSVLRGGKRKPAEVKKSKICLRNIDFFKDFDVWP